jgi:hypothetical protein
MHQTDIQKVKETAYLDWLRNNGAIFDKLKYPVYENGVKGAAAADDIKPKEAFLFIPHRLLITVEGAR